MDATPRLILASTSRYRKALLERLRLPFECIAPGVDEASYRDRAADPRHLASTLARAKAEAVASSHPSSIVIGSDQVAEIDRTVLDKPGDRARAIAQLERLSGSEHKLHTAVTVLYPGGASTDVVTVRLRMRVLDSAAIERYLDADAPYDCAGSYRIEALGIALFDSIDASDFTAIEGLPLLTLASRLREAGLQLP